MEMTGAIVGVDPITKLAALVAIDTLESRQDAANQQLIVVPTTIEQARKLLGHTIDVDLPLAA